VTTSEDWRLEAACRGVDPDLFYPGRGVSTGPAKATCATCAVREPCLDFALSTNEKFGIWGGQSERQRRRTRRDRLVALRSATPAQVAQAWATAVFDVESVMTAWPLLARPVRRILAEAWALDHPGWCGPNALTALTADDPDHDAWGALAAAVGKQWLTAAPEDLRAVSGPWRILEHSQPVDDNRALAVFVRPDDPDAAALPAGASVPAWPVALARSPAGWQVAAWGIVATRLVTVGTTVPVRGAGVR
jgi:WhiB family redox-sensing transcriptional regulator